MTEQKQVLVKFRGQIHAIALPHGMTVGHFQQLVAQQVQVPVANQRFYCKGKRCKYTSETTVEDMFEVPNRPPQQQQQQQQAEPHVLGTLLLLAGASTSDIESMKMAQQQAEREQQIRQNRRIVSIQKRNDQLQSQNAASSRYRFQSIEVLEHFADAHRAREILERLANDRGILQVMQKHQWTVGALVEMAPDGKVGVDPVCVLGLNQNKGQRILLRLRTDDLQGFRKFLTIKKVLYHELSHNVHSDHDSQFYQLMRQIERESQELDWTTQGGRALGGSSRGGGVVGDASEDSGSGSDGGHQLGGDSTRNRLLESVSLSEDQIIANGDNRRQPRPPAPPSSIKDQGKQSQVNEQVLNDDVELDQEDNESSDQSTCVSERNTHDGCCDGSVAQPPDALSCQPSFPTLPWEDDQDQSSVFGTSDQERRLQECVSALRHRLVMDPSVAQSVTLLLQIVSNLLSPSTASSEKFRSIRPSNRLFATRVACFPENVNFLLALGFEKQQVARLSASATQTLQTTDQERLVFVRNDVGLLWLGKSYLELLLQMVTGSIVNQPASTG